MRCTQDSHWKTTTARSSAFSARAKRRPGSGTSVPTRAVVSLGTNSTRLLIVRDLAGSEISQLEHGSIGTRLGEGLGHGRLAEAAMQRTLHAIATFMERVRASDASVSCIATSAMRRASNGAEFAMRVAELTGTQPRVLSGSEEAAASFAGATFGANGAAMRFAVVDVGGGSTECATGRAQRLENATSLEIGAVRLTEQFPALNGSSVPSSARSAGGQARAEAARIVGAVQAFAPVDEARAVGGTPLTLGAIAFSSDVEHVSGRMLSRDAIDALIDRMLALDLESRRHLPGMIAQRADVLPGGALILSEVLRALGADAVRLEMNDLLLGCLLQTGPQAANG